jgi:hypothetical protein
MKPLVFVLLFALTSTFCRPVYASDFGAGFLFGAVFAIVATASTNEEQKASQPAQRTKAEVSQMPVIKAKYPSGGSIVLINTDGVSHRVFSPASLQSTTSN